MADVTSGQDNANQAELVAEGAGFARRIENSGDTNTIYDVNQALFREKLNMPTEDYQTILKSMMATNQSDLKISHYQLPTMTLEDMGAIPVKDVVDTKRTVPPADMPKN
jgi:hypothetical protein